MHMLEFYPCNEYGRTLYYSRDTDMYSMIQDTDAIWIRIKSDFGWVYPSWGKPFDSVYEAECFLCDYDYENGTCETLPLRLEDQKVTRRDVYEAMQVLGLQQASSSCNGVYTSDFNTADHTYHIDVQMHADGCLCVTIHADADLLEYSTFDLHTCPLGHVIFVVDSWLHQYHLGSFSEIELDDAVYAAISTRELSKNLVRVRSSNVWGYSIDIKDRKTGVGDVIVQFKGDKGGPGDIYIYYDVPVKIYRKWHTAPSKGHFFWQYIRNKYYYSKLTSDKKGKLDKAIN